MGWVLRGVLRHVTARHEDDEDTATLSQVLRYCYILIVPTSVCSLTAPLNAVALGLSSVFDSVAVCFFSPPSHMSHILLSHPSRYRTHQVKLRTCVSKMAFLQPPASNSSMRSGALLASSFHTFTTLPGAYTFLNTPLPGCATPTLV